VADDSTEAAFDALVNGMERALDQLGTGSTGSKPMVTPPY
jgi:hypothetical protein